MACALATGSFAQSTTGAPGVAAGPARDQNVTRSFAPAVKRIAPSVVNIFSTKLVRVSPHPFLGIPFFDQLLRGEDDEEPGAADGHPPRTRQQQGLGSGVILLEEGYILTSNHVIDGADEIKVALGNESKTFAAKVVGTDPQTDVAVIKVEGEKLPAATVADSSKLEVGDIVLAVGNPFGVGQAVTMGIVSAVGRGGFGIVEYEDFIQTDASINPGNSGGALVDAEGRLVGINTAILSRSGGSSGVGFAVPINMARGVMDKIIKQGKVTRGYLGVIIQPITPELVEVMSLPGLKGALVADVSSNSPAARIGIKPGDVITRLNDQEVSDSRHLRLMISQTGPNSRVDLSVLRDGKEKKFTSILDEMPRSSVAQAEPEPRPTPSRNIGLSGVDVIDLTPHAREALQIPSTIRGVLITKVDPGSSAYSAGLRPGGIITEINQKPVTNSREAISQSRNLRDKRVLLRVWNEGAMQYLVVENARLR